MSAEQQSQSEPSASVDRPEPLIAKPADTGNEDPPSGTINLQPKSKRSRRVTKTSRVLATPTSQLTRETL